MGDSSKKLESMQSQTSDDVLAADVHAAQQSSMNDELQRLDNELKQANERALRAQAELENFRRRLRREMEEERRYAALPLVADLLVVVDNLDRAVEAAEKNEGANSSLLQGVKMVQSQFLSVLEKHHCRRIGEVGAAFDPNEDQAIAQEPSAQIPAGHVTKVVQFGYRLHDRVIRPAHVLVSTGAAQTAASPAG